MGLGKGGDGPAGIERAALRRVLCLDVVEQVEFLAGTCGGHVECVEIVEVDALPFVGDFIFEGRIPEVFGRIAHQGRRQPHFGGQHVVFHPKQLRVPQTAAGDIGHHHHLEFQTFGFVDTHHLHAVVLSLHLQGRLFGIVFIPPHQIGDAAEIVFLHLVEEKEQVLVGLAVHVPIAQHGLQGIVEVGLRGDGGNKAVAFPQAQAHRKFVDFLAVVAVPCVYVLQAGHQQPHARVRRKFQRIGRGNLIALAYQKIGHGAAIVVPAAQHRHIAGGVFGKHFQQHPFVEVTRTLLVHVPHQTDTHRLRIFFGQGFRVVAVELRMVAVNLGAAEVEVF